VCRPKGALAAAAAAAAAGVAGSGPAQRFHTDFAQRCHIDPFKGLTCLEYSHTLTTAPKILAARTQPASQPNKAQTLRIMHYKAAQKAP